MKTIHDSICELLHLTDLLEENDIEVKIFCTQQELLDVPKEVTESFAKGFLPRITEFFQNEDNMREYVEWKKSQDTKAV